MTSLQIIILLTTLSSGLIAGLFYAYSCSVNPGLQQLSDSNYVAAMQAINRAIQNPVFFITFMGTLVLLPVATFMQYRVGVTNVFWLLLAATILYIIGVFGVTMVKNVPLNDALEKDGVRAAFETAWNKWHAVRTICAVITFGLIVVAIVLKKI